MRKQDILKEIHRYENQLYKEMNDASEERQQIIKRHKWNAVYCLCKKIGITAKDLVVYQNSEDSQ